jgi:hypothetical protein
MTKTATLHLPRDNVHLFGLRTPANGAPPPTHDPTPKLITDPALIQQLRDAMPPKPALHPNQRTLQRTAPNPAKHQNKNRYFIPMRDLETANCHFVDGIQTLAQLAATHAVPPNWLLAQWRKRGWPTQVTPTPPTED